MRSGGKLVLVDYHPFMLLNGVPTHFNAPTGETLAIANTIHLFSDHIWAARNAGLALLELREGLVGEQWIREKPGMARYAGQPVSFAMIWAYN